MSASIYAKSNGTQGALQVNGVDSLVFDNQGLVSGIKDSSITPQKLSGGQTGNAPVFGVRGFALFDGTVFGTNAPTLGGNVTSIQRLSGGNYRATFTTGAPTANIGIKGSGTASTAVCRISSTTSTMDFSVNSTSTGAAVDSAYVFVEFTW